MRFHFLRCHVSEVMRFKDRPDGMVARSPPACIAHEGMGRISHYQDLWEAGSCVVEIGGLWV